MKKVCVFGSYKNLGKKEKADVVKLGKLLAEKGFEVMTGGFGGTMEDISRGAKEAGGKTIGVTYYKWEDQPYKKPNKYIDEEIKTKDIFERIDVMAKNADAFIVLPGGTGTLLELAACLELVNKGLMKPKPIIALGNFWKDTLEKLASSRDLVTFVATPEEAVAALFPL
ncbi:MAG: LOG family protein [Candidatus Omnitrophota bacterium]